MAKRKKTGLCVLCGEVDCLVTREHVPPKNLFLAPRPVNTITVPVCKPCNYEYHLDDEYFRVYIATGAEPGTRLWRLWKEKIVGSSFSRSGGLQGGLNDDHALVIQNHQRQPLRTFEDKVVPEVMLPLVQPFKETRINAVVEKIVRCLHFAQTRSPLHLDAQVIVDVTPLGDGSLHALFEKCTGCVGRHNEFVFRREILAEGTSRWLLAFYEHHTFTVRVNAS